MKPLELSVVEQIIEVLEPLLESEANRRTFLLRALYGEPVLNRIDYSGSTADFVPHLIDTLTKAGTLRDGRPILWAVLEFAREQVGFDIKQRIDSFRPSFSLPPPPRLDRLFVSYSRRNELFARRLVNDLMDAGLRVWYDRDKIKGGENWLNKIKSGVDETDYFVFCLSSDSIHSEVARQELLHAQAQQKTIFPILFQDCIAELKTIESISWLANLHCIDFSQPERYGKSLSELILSLPGYTPPDSFVIERYDPVDLPNPFRGLEVFLEVDAEYFAGRDDAVQHLLTSLIDPKKPRLLAVMGASGSGKSSLVRAGLLPKLRRNFPFWETLIIRPGDSPVNALADRLHQRREVEASSTRQWLRGDSRAVDDIAAELMIGSPADARFVIVVDQFEELFTQANESDRQQFLDLLLYAIRKPGGRVQLLLTMRSDFFDRLSSTPELAELVRDNLDIATEMSREELRQSIETPAKKAGVVFEDGLVDQILEDVRSQPGSLPLLQYALKGLFDLRLGRVLTNNAYHNMGGVQGALADVADKVYNNLSDTKREVLRRLLLRLVNVGEELVTRQSMRRSELHLSGVSETDVDDVLATLTDAQHRLLVASIPLADDTTGEAETYYEVSHEALITHWSKLAGWIQESRADLRLGSDILAFARSWDSTGRSDTSFLLRGNRLFAARDWLLRNDALEVQRIFIEASTVFDQQEQERQRKLQQQSLNRTRLAAVIFAIALVVAVVLSIYALDQQEQSYNAAATSERSALESRSLALAFQARNESERSESVALALAQQANVIPNPPPLAQAALSQLAYRGGELILALDVTAAPDYVSAIAFSSDGRLLATGTNNGTLRIWDAITLLPLYDLEGHQETINMLSFSPDSQHLVSGGGDILGRNTPELHLWNLEQKSSISLAGHSSAITGGGYLGDGSSFYSSDLNGAIFVWRADGAYQNSLIPGESAAIIPTTVASLDGVWVYRIDSYGGGNIHAWNWKTNETRDDTVLAGADGCQATARHPNGQYLLCSNGTLGKPGLFLYDTETGIRQQNYQPVDSQVRSVSFGLGGSRFLTASLGEVQLWETETGTLIHTYHPDTTLPATMSFSPDGRYIMIETQNGQLGIWDGDFASNAVLGEPLLRSDDLPSAGLGGNYIWTSSYDSSGSTLWIGESTGVRAYDTSTATMYRQVPINGGANTLAVLDNGDVIVGSLSGMLLRYDYDSDRIEWSVQAHIKTITGIAGIANEQTIITGSEDGRILFWDAQDGTPINQSTISIPYGVANVAVTADESLLIGVGCAAVSGDNGAVVISNCTEKTLYVWELPTGQLRYTVPASPATKAFAASTDGSLILVTNNEYELLLYETTTGTVLRRFVGHRAPVVGITFNRDATRAISGGNDGLIFIWDVATGQPIRQIEAEESISDIAYSPDETEFSTVTFKRDNILANTIQRWRIDSDIETLLRWTQANRVSYNFTCSERLRFEIAPTCDASGYAPTFTPLPSLTPSPTLDLTQVTVTPSRTPTPSVTPTFTPSPTATRVPIVPGDLPQYGSLYGVQWSPDGTQVLAGEDDGTVIVWNVATGEENYRFENHHSSILAFARGLWSPDGTRIVTYSDDHKALIWNVSTGDLQQELSGHGADILFMAWSPDSARLVSISADNTARVWDAATGQTLFLLNHENAALFDVAWSPNGSQIVTTSGDGTVRLWKANTGELLLSLPDSPQPMNIYGASFSPDGSRVVTTSVDGNATIWDANTGQAIHTLPVSTPPINPEAILYDTAWSSDGNRILIHSLQESPTVWDVESGEQLFALEGHTDIITQAKWSPDETQIITTSLDGTLRYWDATNGALLQTFDTRASLLSMAFSPDGILIATSSSSGTIRIWNRRTRREQQFIFPPARATDPSAIVRLDSSSPNVLYQFR
ncbi:MAG: TIR domain-containing protein [Anaerolineaceae bacterium]|nr:TIR domain-containing protein [Anaerolineaceae bacterium]